MSNNYEPLGPGEFMRAMMNADYDGNICDKCGGTGLKPVMCCSGNECGCLGMPVDFVACGCGIPEPTNEQLSKWADE